MVGYLPVCPWPYTYPRVRMIAHVVAAGRRIRNAHRKCSAISVVAVPAVGELVRCTDGSWMTRPPQSCPRGHLLRPGAMLVGHQPCSACRGGHTTWTCLDCGGVVYGPPLTAGCRILVGAAAVR